MMTQDFIIDVSEVDFEYEVIAYSQNVPVIVDFLAEWRPASLEMSHTLEQLAREANGAFRLAHVNIEANPNLAMLYGVRSIPTIKAFSGGDVVGEFSGPQPEERLREFIAHIQPPSPIALATQKASSLLAAERWQEAEDLLRDVMDTSEVTPGSLLGLARALLAQGKSHEALAILTSFPASRLYTHAEALLPYATELEQLRQHPIGEDSDDISAAYWNAVRLSARGRIQAAMDGLLDILRLDKRDTRAHRLLLSLLELLGDENPQTGIYRKELASLLF